MISFFAKLVVKWLRLCVYVLAQYKLLERFVNFKLHALRNLNLAKKLKESATKYHALVIIRMVKFSCTKRKHAKP